MEASIAAVEAHDDRFRRNESVSLHFLAASTVLWDCACEDYQSRRRWFFEEFESLHCPFDPVLDVVPGRSRFYVDSGAKFFAQLSQHFVYLPVGWDVEA